MPGPHASIRPLYIAGLGAWTSYKPVVYRVYYPEGLAGCETGVKGKSRRLSLMAASRLGVAALATAHYYAWYYNSSSGEGQPATGPNGKYAPISMAFIAPLTLLTIISPDAESLKGHLEKLKEGRGASVIRSLICEGVNSLFNKVKITEEEVNMLKELLQKNSNNSENKIRVIVVKDLNCDQEKPDIIIQEAGGLPQVYRIRSKLNIKVLEGEVESESTVGVNVYLIIVPLTYTTRYNGKEESGVLVRFIEKRPEKWPGAVEGTILRGLRAVIDDWIKNSIGHPGDPEGDSSGSSHPDQEASTSYLIVYDTTHGLNTLVSALSEAARLATLYSVLRLQVRGLQPRMLSYNSAPLPSIKPADMQMLEVTWRDNVPYYYTEVRLERVLYEGRALIDEVVGSLATNASRGKGASKDKLLALYLLKLGIIPWSLYYFRASEKAPQSSEPRSIVGFEPDLKDGVELVVNYKLEEGDARFSLEVEKLETLYSALRELAEVIEERVVFKVCGGSHQDFQHTLEEALGGDAVCVDLRRLKSLLVGGGGKSDSNSGSTDREISGLLASLIEPGMRVIVGNEMEEWIDHTLRVLRYQVPEDFRLESCGDITSWGSTIEMTGCGDDVGKIILFRPPLPAQLGEKAARNFLAHAGLSRITWRMGWILTSRGKGEDCRALGVCVASKLPETVEEMLISMR
jgi:hypothetical protein